MATASLTYTLARRYAQALFSHVANASEQDALAKELAQWAAATQEGQPLHGLAHNPTLPRAAQATLLQELATSQAASEALRKALVVLAEQRRLDLLPLVAESFTAMLREARGRRLATVVSATALSDADKAAIAKALGSSTDIEWETDSALLGGLTVTINGKTLDYSLASRLVRTKRALENEAA